MGRRSGNTVPDVRGGESVSFLVRMWREPISRGNGPVRVYLRNLQSGEELYFGDPKRVGEILSLEAEAIGCEQEDDATGESQANAG